MLRAFVPLGVPAVRDRELYAKILGLEPPWTVTDVDLDLAAGRVVVRLGRAGEAPLACPECHRPCPGYDAQPRRWRHLDTCQFQTILEADVPRCQCPEHGVKQVPVPWAEPGGRFTALFERLVIDWIGAAGRQATARRLGLSWDQADGIMQRAVDRGLARREAVVLPVLGVDEKSFQGREFVTVVCDLDGGAVLHVADGRGRDALQECYAAMTPEQRDGIAAVAMDMHQPYVAATQAVLPAATIVFDKFHVAKLAGVAVDQVRRQEAKGLAADGDDALKRTRYAWLRNPQTETARQRREAAGLRASHLKTARAWGLKEELMDLFRYAQPAAARRCFRRWYGWAVRSRLRPMVRLAKTLKARLDLLLNYCRWPITNAVTEALNSTIQWIKYTARGFRSRDGFRRAIYFHCGGLQLYP
jgi:transposase